MNMLRVDDVMTQRVVTLGPEDTIEDAARMLGQNRIGAAPVVKEGRLTGLVSEADPLRASAQPARGSTDVGISPQAFLLRGTPPKPVLADHKTTRDRAINIAARVPCDLKISDDLKWHWDDTALAPGPNRADPNELGSDPWAVGPLMEGIPG